MVLARGGSLRPFKDSKCGFAKTHFGLGGGWGAVGGRLGGASADVLLMPHRFCACRVTYIIEPPRKYKGYAGLWTRCIECRGWIEMAEDGGNKRI